MTTNETKTFIILKYGSLGAYFDLWIADKITPSRDELVCMNECMDEFING